MIKRKPESTNIYFDDYIRNFSELADGTKTVAAFYEDEPFPNYNGINSRHLMIQQAELGQYSRAISELCPTDGSFLEIGCGTGQLTNYVGLEPNRIAIGLDLSKASLDLAGAFKLKTSIVNTKFLRADIFDHPFEKDSFDVVVANGVLHHTIDTWQALRQIEEILKPGGYAVIGLYNFYGRWRTNVLRKVSHLLGRRLLTLLDPITNRKLNKNAARSWINDQYFHPLERSHSYDECIKYMNNSALNIVRFIPDPLNFYPQEKKLNLAEERNIGTLFDRFSAQLLQGALDHADGGLFSVIYRKED
tara:strand:+ start:532 stop:1443 length:912 start_codon:yes stop_codon:yes gene_type:complete